MARHGTTSPIDGAILRARIGAEEFDHQALLCALSSYARPRDRITVLLRQGTIIRVKKGLYVFGEIYRRGPFSRELLANLIYGPSYISLDYALAHYGLIPERAAVVTSVTTGRSRSFRTPIGAFSYRHLAMDFYRTGIDRVELGDSRGFLMATPEKALADKIISDRRGSLRSLREMDRYLLEDLRIDPEGLRSIDVGRFSGIAVISRSRKALLLADYLRRSERGERRR